VSSVVTTSVAVASGGRTKGLTLDVSLMLYSWSEIPLNLSPFQLLAFSLYETMTIYTLLLEDHLKTTLLAYSLALLYGFHCQSWPICHGQTTSSPDTL